MVVVVAFEGKKRERNMQKAYDMIYTGGREDACAQIVFVQHGLSRLVEMVVVGLLTCQLRGPDAHPP